MTRLLLVAAAGAGATDWHVYPGAGTPIQDAIDGAEEGDTIYVHAGTMPWNVEMGKPVTLTGDGTDDILWWR